MSTTLQERIQDRMKIVGLSNAQLAAACKVKPPTSFNWASGKTKNIKGVPLLLAAKALGVTPEWLADGIGPKHPTVPDQKNNKPLALERRAPVALGNMAQVLAALTQCLGALDLSDRKEAMRQITVLVEEPERHAKVAASIEAMAATAFAQAAQKRA